MSLPSGVGTSQSLLPRKRSGAPHSSQLMCAFWLQMTFSHGRSSDCSAVTLAPVPLKTKKTSTCSPSSERKRSTACCGVGVVAVGHDVSDVDLGDLGEDVRVDAGVVVAGEAAVAHEGPPE